MKINNPQVLEELQHESFKAVMTSGLTNHDFRVNKSAKGKSGVQTAACSKS